MIAAHLRPIPKVRPHGLYFSYYPVGFFFRDRPHMSHSDIKLVSRSGRWGILAKIKYRTLKSVVGTHFYKSIKTFEQ
jgi:hypothetical protein